MTIEKKIHARTTTVLHIENAETYTSLPYLTKIKILLNTHRIHRKMVGGRKLFDVWRQGKFGAVVTYTGRKTGRTDELVLTFDDSVVYLRRGRLNPLATDQLLCILFLKYRSVLMEKAPQ
jgi:hypothetical protein